jgi:16S rRNA processing protein RimM
MTRGPDIAPERRILIARMIGAFGISGEIKCQSFANPEQQLLKYKPLIMVHNGVERILDSLSGRMMAKGLVIRLPEITDRDAAQALHGAELWITRSQLPAPKDGEFYWVDLEGLRVVNREGISLGTVSHLFDTPANPILVAQGERDRLIPFLMDRFIDAVDIEAGEVRVDWDADF